MATEGLTNQNDPGAGGLTWSERTRGGLTIGLGLDVELDNADIASVIDRLTGNYTRDQHLSEGRATILPSRSGLRYDGIKIKGAGLLGAVVDFSRLHAGTYDLPCYDFEGNYAPDRARAFHRPYAGGMSYQQAVNEYQVSRFLTDHGFDTYPPVGYGYIRKAEQTSWFCLLNAPFQPYWKWHSPDFDRQLVEQVPRFTARAQMRMKDLGLALVLFGVANIAGRLVRKDLHPVRFTGRNDSFMSRICYYFFDTNLVLYTLAYPMFETGISGWVETAWCEYVGELCAGSPDYEAVRSFKDTLLKLKLNDHSTLEERMAIIRGDPVAVSLCREFMTEQEQKQFL